MLTFHIITIFPDSLRSYIETSIMRKAQERGKVKIKFYNPRDFTTDKHRSVDDKPYGGGAGMILAALPILKAVAAAKSKIKNQKSKIVVLSAKGKQFEQKTAVAWAKQYKHIILIAGRYEGIDERVQKILKAEEISIGPYVLTDGELPAMIIVSAITRLIPGVIRWDSHAEESYYGYKLKKEERGLLEHPHYTRPEVLAWKGKKYSVPKILLGGHHGKIEEWRALKQKHPNKKGGRAY